MIVTLFLTSSPHIFAFLRYSLRWSAVVVSCPGLTGVFAEIRTPHHFTDNERETPFYFFFSSNYPGPDHPRTPVFFFRRPFLQLIDYFPPTSLFLLHSKTASLFAGPCSATEAAPRKSGGSPTLIGSLVFLKMILALFAWPPCGYFGDGRPALVVFA